MLADYAAEPTEPLDTIAKRYGTSASALRRWSVEDADIAATYTRARTVSAGGLEDEIVSLLGTVTPENYNAVRLKVDTLKWLAAKRHPKEYGDKVVNEHNVNVASLHLDALRAPRITAQAVATPTRTLPPAEDAETVTE